MQPAVSEPVVSSAADISLLRLLNNPSSSTSNQLPGSVQAEAGYLKAGNAADNLSDPNAAAEEYIVLVQNVPSNTSDASLRERFSACGTIIWTSFLSPEVALIRFTKKESVLKAIASQDGSTWQSSVLKVEGCVQAAGGAPSTTGDMPQQGDGSKAASFISEEPDSVDFRLASFHERLQEADLVRCDPTWNATTADHALCEPLESSSQPEAGPGGVNDTSNRDPASFSGTDPLPSQDDVWLQLMRSGGPLQGPGSADIGQLFGQKSIATTARQDLERMAALANLAQSKAPAASPWATLGQAHRGQAAAFGMQEAPRQESSAAASSAQSVNARTSLPESGRPSEQFASLEQLLGVEIPGLNLDNLNDDQKMMLIRTYLMQQQQQQQQQLLQAQQFHVAQQQQVSQQLLGAATSMKPAAAHHRASLQAALRQSSHGPAHTSIKDSLSSMGSRNLGSPALSTASSLSGPLLNLPSTSSPQPQPSLEDVLASFASALAASQAGPHAAPSLPSSSSGAGLNPGLAGALVQAAMEQGMDQGAIAQLLQNKQVLELLGSKAPQPSAPLMQAPAPDLSGLARKVSAMKSSSVAGPSAADWSQHSSSSATGLGNPAGVQQLLSSHLLSEFVSSRSVLVQLMLSAYAFLNSDSLHEFYDKLAPVGGLYDEMHDLPVVQKRIKCQEMGYHRLQLMNDAAFTQILQAICALRHHLYSLSRKVLVMNQGPDGIPIDLLLGSMSSELYHLMKSMLPQEVSDFFGNNLPHPRLAVLVFAEFTTVDPAPITA